MEILTFDPHWWYTLGVAVILAAIVVWRKDFRIPRPRKKEKMRE